MPDETKQQKSLEEMSLDELRELTLAELSKPEGEALAEPPRDDKGRFAKAEEKPAEDEEVVYEYRIDLGDGAGVQVFEGKTQEELIQKLGKAQEHATRKIREQAEALKSKPEPLPEVEVEKPLSDHDKWLLQQRMLADPLSVINEYVQTAVSKKEAERQAAEEAQRQAIEAATKATDDWVAANPDYYASPKNGKRIEKFLALEGLELTPENLSKAFTELSADGLLEARPAEATKAEPEEEQQQQVTRRIVEPAASTVTTVRRKVVGGITTKRSAPVATTTPELTEEQLYKMPMAELEQMLLRSMRQ